MHCFGVCVFSQLRPGPEAYYTNPNLCQPAAASRIFDSTTTTLHLRCKARQRHRIELGSQCCMMERPVIFHVTAGFHIVCKNVSCSELNPETEDPEPEAPKSEIHKLGGSWGSVSYEVR